jgi:hypothetical protein
VNEASLTDRAARALRGVCGFFVAIAAGRITFVAVATALASGRVAERTFPEAMRELVSAAPAVEEPGAEEPDDAPISDLAETSVRMTLAVTVGPPRSEVYVLGRPVGQTPYIGEISCKEGRNITVDVVPEQAAAISFTRQCRDGTLRLTDDSRDH